MADTLDKLVSDIIEQLDYDLWKEVYLYKNEPYEDEGFGLDNQVRDLIEDWYDTKVRKKDD